MYKLEVRFQRIYIAHHISSTCSCDQNLDRLNIPGDLLIAQQQSQRHSQL
jgi:hypothetical protein